MQRNPFLSERPGRLARFLAPMLVMALALALAAAPRPAHAGSLKLVGQLGGLNTALAVEGEKAYVCEGLNLTIYNVKNSENPTVISRTRLPEQGFAIQMRNGLAYIAGFKGFYIFDARAANAPRKLGAYPFTNSDLQGADLKLDPDGDRVYLSSVRALVTLDVSRPSSPKRALTMKTDTRQSLLTVSGGLLLASDWATPKPHVFIYSVSDPSTITLKSRITVNDFSRYAAISGKMAYLSGHFTLLALDLSNPARPVKKGEYFMDYDSFDDLSVNGDRLHVLVRSRALDPEGTAHPQTFQFRIYDVSDPAKLRERGHLDLGLASSMLAVRGDKAYLVNGSELSVVNISDPRRPAVKGRYRQPLHTFMVRAKGDTAYSLTSERELAVIDLRKPAAPAWRGASSMKTAEPWALATANGRVYIADHEKGLLTYDVSKPDAPKLLGACAPKDFKPVSLAVSGARVYATDALRRFRIYDLAKPDKPRELGRLLLPTTGSLSMSLRLVGVEGGRACLTAHDYDYRRERPVSSYRIFLVDVANPAAPRLVKTISLPLSTIITEAAFSGGYLYADLFSWSSSAQSDFLALDARSPAHLAEASAVAVSGQSKLFVLDARDPAHPKEVSSPALRVMNNLIYMTISGTRLFAMAPSSGFKVYDIRHPGSPKLLGENNNLFCTSFMDIHAQGDYLYFVDQEAGLLIFKYEK